jgi:hypothetical protein
MRSPQRQICNVGNNCMKFTNRVGDNQRHMGDRQGDRIPDVRGVTQAIIHYYNTLSRNAKGFSANL